MGNNIIKNQFALQYMFGGKSEFVIENIITHNRFLYQIKQAQNNKNLYFVYAKQITTDTDEISKKNYSGYFIFNNGYYNYRKGKHGHLDVKDKPIMALTYTINRLKMSKLQSCVHIKHTGRCGICGRRLTDDASVERGFGISCYNKYIMQKSKENYYEQS